MLTHLQIQNFKSWWYTGKIRLAPITVFFGANSSGKSSLNQFLLMLQQTAQSPDRQRVLHLGDDQTPVELGTFRDIVFDHDEEQEIAFTLGWDLPSPLSVEDPKSGDRFRGSQIEFFANVANPPGKVMSLRKMQYRLLEEGKPALTVGMERTPSNRYGLSSAGYRLVRTQGRKWPLPPPYRFYGFPDEAIAYFQNSGFVADLALSLEKQLERIYYLGPLRDYPKRHYTWSGATPAHVGWKGERAIEALLSARDRKLNSGPKKRQVPFERMVAQWLLNLDLIQSFEARPLAEHRKEYEVLVKTRSSRGQKVNLTDIGFGVSQVLPVIVQCFYAPPHATVLLEQPEIHLHPKVQSSLADLFIEVIRSREGGRERNIQLIIESHSEHFLRRLQRRVAEEAIRPEETALYFIEAGPDGASSIHNLELDELGNISNWPDGFFGDEIGDIAAMTEAAMRRRLARR